VPVQTLLVIAAAWLAVINLATFWAVGWDKRQAVKRRRRIPENGFHSLAALGGAPGGWIGMAVYRHKTDKVKFQRRFRDAFLGQLLMLACVAVIWAVAKTD